jgi:hypothetical protein
MERARQEQRQRLQDREQRHVQEAVRLATENTRRLKAEAGRIERALEEPNKVLGSKEPLRDGRVASRFSVMAGWHPVATESTLLMAACTGIAASSTERRENRLVKVAAQIAATTAPANKHFSNSNPVDGKPRRRG